MSEVQIKVEIQNAKGQVQKRLTVAVPTDITENELIAGLGEELDFLKNSKADVFIKPSDNHPITGNLLENGARVIVRLKTSASMVRMVKEED